MTDIIEAVAYVQGFRPETPEALPEERDASDFEAQKACEFLMKIIWAAEQGNQHYENMVVKAARAVGAEI